MAIFIASLAMEGRMLSAAKVGILGGSVASALLGVVILVMTLPKGRQLANPGGSGH